VAGDRPDGCVGIRTQSAEARGVDDLTAVHGRGIWRPVPSLGSLHDGEGHEAVTREWRDHVLRRT
jgi:hypothetical protein